MLGVELRAEEWGLATNGYDMGVDKLIMQCSTVDI